MPLLFSFFINDISSVTSTLKIRLFADDIQAYSPCYEDSLPSFVHNVNEDLFNINNWCLNNSLIINGNKTQLITFTEFHYSNQIFLNGVILQPVDTAKCLRFYIDRKLSWEFHINTIIKKINFLIRTLYHSNLYFPRHIRSNVAHSILMSQLTYGIEIFAGTNASNLNNLQICLNNIVRYVYKVSRRDHISEFVSDFLGCSFKKFISFRCIFLLYKILYFKQPNYLFQKFNFSRSTRVRNLIIPYFRTNIMANSFLVRVIVLWNQYVPSSFRNIPIHPFKFRRKFKEFFYLSAD